MRRVALKGLWLRRGRALLTALAVVLGVAMISGTYILTDTIDSAFKTLFTESYAGTDAVVTGKGLDISVDEYGQTIVMVTHDARAAAIAHRVLFLADGTIFRELGECDAHTIHTVMDELAAA